MKSNKNSYNEYKHNVRLHLNSHNVYKHNIHLHLNSPNESTSSTQQIGASQFLRYDSVRSHPLSFKQHDQFWCVPIKSNIKIIEIKLRNETPVSFVVARKLENR